MKPLEKSHDATSVKPTYSGGPRVPSALLLALARQTLGGGYRLRRIVRQKLLAPMPQADSIRVEDNLFRQQGSRRETACRLLNQNDGALLATADIVIDVAA